MVPRNVNVGEEKDTKVTDTDHENDGNRQETTSTPAKMRGKARIEHLTASITKIQEQIEKTRRELDTVCDGLREAEVSGSETADVVSRSVLPVMGNGSESTDTVVSLSQREPAGTSNLSNEQIIERARTTVNGHIKMLTRYNEMKDVAMGLFELIAQHRGVRIGEVLRDEGAEMDD